MRAHCIHGKHRAEEKATPRCDQASCSGHTHTNSRHSTVCRTMTASTQATRTLPPTPNFSRAFKTGRICYLQTPIKPHARRLHSSSCGAALRTSLLGAQPGAVFQSSVCNGIPALGLAHPLTAAPKLAPKPRGKVTGQHGSWARTDALPQERGSQWWSVGTPQGSCPSRRLPPNAEAPPPVPTRSCCRSTQEAATATPRRHSPPAPRPGLASATQQPAPCPTRPRSPRGLQALLLQEKK